MNKRIKKKNDDNRIFDMYFKTTIRHATEVADAYARLEGYKEANDIFWRYCEEDYNKWNKLPRAKRCRTYIRSKHNIPKFVGYKNKIIRT